MLRRLLLAVATMLVPLAMIIVPSAAKALSLCTDGVSVVQFAFSPTSIPASGVSTLTLTLQNCGTQTVSGSTVTFGQYAGQSCPVIDPLPPTPYTIPVGGTYQLNGTYGGAGGNCQPTSLTIHANINVNGVTGTVNTVTAVLQFAPPCINGIAIKQFSFNPATAAVGQASTLTGVIQNCGTQTETGFSIWSFKFTGTGTGQPPGCPVFDPVAFSYSLAPGATSTSTLGLDDPFASCQATGITATDNVSESGVTGVAATATANLAITGAVSGGCHVTYTPNNWQGGFTANVTINNTGSTAINGWTLTFAFPGDQKITTAWNAAVTQSSVNVTATNLSYNSTISPGGSQSFGFQGSWNTSDASPTGFSVNGMACT